MEFRQHHHLIRPGFSLVEVIITLAIVAVLSTLGWSGLSTSRQRAAGDAAVQRVRAVISDAQSRSMTAVDGLAWNVKCNGATATVFSTAVASGIIRSFPSHTTCVGPDIHFVKLLGQSTVDTTWTVTVQGRATARITVSVGGAITSQPL